MAVQILTQANFNETVQSDKPVIIDFWAPWCGPCRMVGPVLEQIEAEHGLTIGKLNTDENPAITGKLGITSIPTMNVYVGGEIVKTIMGAQPKPKLLRELEPFIG